MTYVGDGEKRTQENSEKRKRFRFLLKKDSEL
jgi:hypothetical protein